MATEGVSGVRPQVRDFRCTKMCHAKASGNSTPSFRRNAGLSMYPTAAVAKSVNPPRTAIPRPIQFHVNRASDNSRSCLKSFPRAEQPEIERQRRTEPKGEPRKVGPLDEGIRVPRRDQPHHQPDVLQLFANARKPSVHEQEPLDRYERGDFKSREDRSYPQC